MKEAIQRRGTTQNLNGVRDDCPPGGVMTDPKPAGGMTGLDFEFMCDLTVTGVRVTQGLFSA